MTTDLAIGYTIYLVVVMRIQSTTLSAPALQIRDDISFEDEQTMHVQCILTLQLSGENEANCRSSAWQGVDAESHVSFRGKG